MGVQGLWKLLECTGRPINAETLEGKILAIDISIWLNQAVKGARDRQGNAIQNAHLLTLFHRLCKLLFFRIRPIFVFDGEAPLLKRQTLAKRRQRKDNASNEAKKTHEKLLRTFLKRQAIKAALSGNKQSNDELPSFSKVRRKETDDLYILPPLEDNEKYSSEEEEERAWEERMTQKQRLQEEFFANPSSVDIESEEFISLPPEVKHEILTDMKEFTKRRRTLFEAMPEDSNDFSQYQLSGLLKKNNLNKCIDNVRKELNQQYSGEVQAQFEAEGGFLKEVETRRLVSEDNSHYILIKGIQSKKEEKKVDSPPQSVTYNSSQTPKTYLDLKLASARKAKSSQAASADEEPPSPRTLFAIQEAMTENILDENWDDEKHEKPSVSVREAEGNVSPRTLQAIYQVLAEDEAGQSNKKKTVVQSEREHKKAKVIVISSSDEEDNCLNNQGRTKAAFGVPLINRVSPSSVQCQESAVSSVLDCAHSRSVSQVEEPSNEVNVVEMADHNLQLDNRNVPIAQDTLIVSSSTGNAENPVTLCNTIPVTSEIPLLSVNRSIQKSVINPYNSGSFDSSRDISLQGDANKQGFSDNPVVDVLNSPFETALKSSSALGESSNTLATQLLLSKSNKFSDPSMGQSCSNTLLKSPFETALKSSSALSESSNTPATQLLLSKSNKYSDASMVQGCSNTLEVTQVIQPSAGSEVKQPAEDNPPMKVLGSNDSGGVYVPMTPESIIVSDEEICDDKKEDSDSDDSFIEVESELSNSNSQLVVKEPEDTREAATKIQPAGESSSDCQDSSLGHGSGEPREQLNNKDSEDIRNEWQDISVEELESLENNLYVQQTSLQAQRQQQERIAATVTGQMCLESQELLRLFGIPYIVAPMEAEAQCAILDLTDQTSGTITDDSDIWLFGARHVYKNFFTQNKHVEYYQYADIHNQLGLDRSKLINLAYLLGSDYTEGIPTVGYVSAMEILNEFPAQGLESLLQFKEWWTEAQKDKKMRPNPHDTKVKKKLRRLEIHQGFPNPAVANAYLKPVVDESKAAFCWGRPDLEQIREFCESRFGWYRSKTDEVLLPVLKQINAQQTQLRIDSFFRLEQHEAIGLKSQRLRRAVTCMKRKQREGETAEVEAAVALMEKECSYLSKGQKSNTKSQGTKRRKPSKHSQEDQGPVHTGGGFIGSEFKTSEVYSSDGSSSDAEDLQSGIIDDHSECGIAASQKASNKVESSTSSSDDEESTVLVTAKPVFQGTNKKSKTVKRTVKK
ncbi:hypothetical protein XENTR_v10006415 [Xenopus tropicalis]|uniref:DNA repair protein complementing XP-G cells isoform X1 n=1 Tax=Xenopus tropicalis TaxID=8364 RepID=A0A8J0SE75_XENTR|nr:DNA repair protein complementing XP-G cells isoform X1 [Xenopus tropicalis]KAE8625854.1 hypothetical protein XENTR_v10006415 [Xenopus tropicalis]|eukprot:XP_012811722.1 PREDICTED: DNA repair protein complementing XP-G cells isoform X1 [Xenopus tropicalis]